MGANWSNTNGEGSDREGSITWGGGSNGLQSMFPHWNITPMPKHPPQEEDA